MLIKSSKVRRRIIYGFMLLSMLLFFVASALNHITVEKCKKLNLPILYIVTDNNKRISKKESYVGAHYELDEFYGKCKIRGHGNTTWVTRELYKKPYLLNLEKSAPLAGLQRAKKWILMANTADKAVLRNFYGENLAKNAWNNFKWTPSSRFITLIVNGKYSGLYELFEKVEMENGRLADFCGPGSFLACVNSRMDKEYNFITKNNIKFSIRSPEATQDVYVSWHQILQSFEDKIYSGLDWTDSELGKYLDLDSFVDWFIVNDFSKNHDARFQASCFVYYDTDSKKLYMGPAWDFDLAFGNIAWDNCEKTDGFWVCTDGWYEQLWKLEKFRKSVKKRWNERKSVLNSADEWLEEQSLFLKNAIDLNNTIWPAFGKRQWPHTNGWKDRKNHKMEIDYFSNWIKNRYSWYDEAINQL
ncbi:MAG: CotH kinase family protein [Treponema sp.]|nr:CotH kinase family protein [Treponema sp.]